jgi:hypothetical protein
VHEINLPTWKNAKHGQQFIATLRSYAFPVMGHRPVSEVSSADVLTVLMPITATLAAASGKCWPPFENWGS